GDVGRGRARERLGEWRWRGTAGVVRPSCEAAGAAVGGSLKKATIDLPTLPFRSTLLLRLRSRRSWRKDLHRSLVEGGLDRLRVDRIARVETKHLLFDDPLRRPRSAT